VAKSKKTAIIRAKLQAWEDGRSERHPVTNPAITSFTPVHH